MVLMTSNRELMGRYTNTPLARVWGWAMVGVLIGLTLATLWHIVSQFR